MSITQITYLNQFYPNAMFHSSNCSVTIFYFYDIIEIVKWLETLEQNQAYVVTFDFVFSFLTYNDDSPLINLAKPIIVTKNSNPNLISTFIRERIRLACDSYYLDDQIMDMLSKDDGPAILEKYKEINLYWK